MGIDVVQDHRGFVGAPVMAAARLLGVHPNTLRAWADQGRVRCLRVNSRGDRRFLESWVE